MDLKTDTKSWFTQLVLVARAGSTVTRGFLHPNQEQKPKRYDFKIYANLTEENGYLVF